MPVQNELQYRYSKQMSEMRQLYPAVVESILGFIAEGDTVTEAVDKGFKESFYESQSEELTVKNTIGASQSGLGKQLSLDLGLAPDYFLFTKFSDGVNLSDTLHSGEAQRAVKGVLKDYFKFKGNVDELTKRLKAKNGRPNTYLPRYIRELVDLRSGFGTPNDTRQFAQATAKAMREVNKLNAAGVTETSRLQKAYAKVIEAATIPDAAGLQSAVDYALNVKVDYINRRIARSELARAYDMSFQRQMEEDDDIVLGFKWLLSPAHPRPDICDYHAEVDAYGMGAGVYPKGEGPRVPAHPNCLCSKVPVYDEGQRKGRFSQQRAKDYLDSVSEYKRKQIIGAKYAENGDYKRGLEKQGVNIKGKPRMISKSVLTKGGKDE